MAAVTGASPALTAAATLPTRQAFKRTDADLCKVCEEKGWLVRRPATTCKSLTADAVNRHNRHLLHPC